MVIPLSDDINNKSSTSVKHQPITLTLYHHCLYNHTRTIFSSETITRSTYLPTTSQCTWTPLNCFVSYQTILHRLDCLHQSKLLIRYIVYKPKLKFGFIYRRDFVTLIHETIPRQDNIYLQIYCCLQVYRSDTTAIYRSTVVYRSTMIYRSGLMLSTDLLWSTDLI